MLVFGASRGASGSSRDGVTAVESLGGVKAASRS